MTIAPLTRSQRAEIQALAEKATQREPRDAIRAVMIDVPYRARCALADLGTLASAVVPYEAALVAAEAHPATDALLAEVARLSKLVGDVRKLADGTEPHVGQRVITVGDVAARWELAHAHDELVHEITSLLHGDAHLVGCGPKQIGVKMLRLAPDGAEVTCPSCATWREQEARRRADAEVYRREQIGEVFALRAHLLDLQTKYDVLAAHLAAMTAARDELASFTYASSANEVARIAALRAVGADT